MRDLAPFLCRPDPVALLLGHGDSDLWTIRCSDIVGAVGMVRGELLIFVVPALHRRGIGKTALAAYIATVAPDGQAILSARIARSNLASRRLFTSLGFADCGLWHAPGATEPLVAFRLPIPARAVGPQHAR